jgi:resolvase-like protein/uncharacterized protein DUF3363
MWGRSGDHATPKVALYARYSTDNQSVVSIEDPFRICREHAGRECWQVVDTYQDAAISGASVILRPGVQSLLQDAQRGRFDIVLAEALDRVSRDQADVATLFKHLRFAGVQIVTLAEGEISELHVGLKGTMNALFLKDLAAKTGEYVSGTLVGSTQLASGRFAMTDDGIGLQLVPWQPVLDKRIGQHITGTVRDAGGIEWGFGENGGWDYECLHGWISPTQSPACHHGARPAPSPQGWRASRAPASRLAALTGWRRPGKGSSCW